MDQDRVLQAFRCEAQELSRAVADLAEAEWDAPTRCEPWSVRELLGHVRVAIAWLPAMLDSPAPDRAEINAVEYYRPDDRFSPQTNTARIGLAQQQAAGYMSGEALAEDFTATWRHVERLCRDQPADRVVRTRHGDAMSLAEFLLTRVLEVALHGLDLADALRREPWLTPMAEDVVLELLIRPGRMAAASLVGWDGLTLLRKITGRAPLEPAEAAQLEQHGIRWLALG